MSVLKTIDAKLALVVDYVLENRAPVEDRIAVRATHLVDTPAGAVKKESSIVVPTAEKGKSGSPVLVNQNGDKVDKIGDITQTRLDFKTVQAEAQLLCNIEKETTKAGFHRAKAIISSFGVGKIAELDPSKYDEIVGQFRGAVKTWRS